MSKYGFGNVASVMGQQTKQAAILIMRASKQYFGEAFDNEQLGDEKWAEVARRKVGNPFNEGQIVGGTNKPTGKRFVVNQGDDYATRKILSGITGRLKYKTVKADSSITNMGAMSVMTNPVPYAKFSQEGTPYQPARPFMAQTPQLTEIQLLILEQETGKAWKVSKL